MAKKKKYKFIIEVTDDACRCVGERKIKYALVQVLAANLLIPFKVRSLKRFLAAQMNRRPRG